MRIREFLREGLVLGDIDADDKDGALWALATHLVRQGATSQLDERQVVDALLARERLGSTGVGEGVAIPHAKLSGLTDLVACFARCRGGVGFNAIDGQPVHLIFGLLVPENSAGVHLKALARISRLLKRVEFREVLMRADDSHAIYEAFVEEDGKF